MVTYPQIFVLEYKHPLEDVDYPVSLVNWMTSGESATVTSLVFSTGIDVGTGAKEPTISGTTLTFWLDGGTHGVTYYGQAVIETSGTRTFVIDFSITVIDPTA